MLKRKRGDKKHVRINCPILHRRVYRRVIGLAIFGLIIWSFIGVVVYIIDTIINTILSIPTIIADWFTSTSMAILNWVTNIPTEILNWVTTLF